MANQRVIYFSTRRIFIVITQSPNHSITGFTLVELLMAATLFSILMVGVVAQLRGGVLAWRRTTSAVEELQQVRVAMDRIADDLANAVVLDPQPASALQTQFSRGMMRFYTVGTRVRLVQYALVDDGGSSRLMRAVQSAQEAQAGQALHSEPLLAGAKNLSLRYAALPGDADDRIVWQDQWTDPAGLPKLVELTMDVQTSANVRHVRRVVEIPSGHLQQQSS